MFEAPTEHLKSLQQLEGGGGNPDTSSNGGGSTSKQAKRRSLLPTFSTSRKTSSEEKESMIREDTSDSEVSSRARESEDTRSMPPPPKPSRTSSLRPPGGAAARSAATHVKTTSKESNVMSAKPSLPPGGPTIPQRTDSLHKRTGSTRLPQTHRSSASSGGSAQQSIPARGSSARATTSTTAQKRSSVVMGRPPALDTSVTRRPQSRQSPTSPTNSSSKPATKSQVPPPSSRPAFSTYQQHYSPAKTGLPKPPLPTTKQTKTTASVNPEADTPVSLETAMEQIELLQLSLLHQHSARVLEEYEASAREKLEKTHSKLRKDYQSIRSHEREQRKALNLNAIESWCPDQALLTEHLQTLSRVVSDLRVHTEPGSRYSDLTDTFDKWVGRAESILLDDKTNASFIEALPETWRAAHTSVALKLRSIQRDMEVLPPSPPSNGDDPSSLEIILDSCSALVDSMLKELEVMTKLQKEVLQQGKARIDEQINALICANEQAQSSDKENWAPAWQSVR